MTLRLDRHRMYVVHNGMLAKTLPAPLDEDQRAAPVAGAIRVERKVPTDGVIMIARQRLGVGRTYAGELATVHVEDTYFRITLTGADLSLHPRKEQRPVTRFRAIIHAPKM